MRASLGVARAFARARPRWRASSARRNMSAHASAGAVTSNANEFSKGDGSTDWEGMWSAGVGKGQAFDCSRTEPAFQRAIDAGELAIGGGRAIVPGCGRGYSLASLARGGFRDVVGLEISNTAKDACERQLGEETIPDDAKVTVLAADFFSFSPGERFDLAYDCTFLCAIDPKRRSEWARKYAEIIAPGGTLVCLVFPCGDFQGGPPYAISPQIVRELLSPAGFEEIELRETPSEMYARGRLEYLHTWRRV